MHMFPLLSMDFKHVLKFKPKYFLEQGTSRTWDLIKSVHPQSSVSYLFALSSRKSPV